MSILRLDLIPSKQLFLSYEVVELLSRTFQRSNVKILERKLNTTLRLKISFERRRRLLEKEINRFQLKAREAKEKNRTRVELTRFKVFRDILKALKAEVTAIRGDFLLTIAESKVIIQTTCSNEISELSTFYSEMYYDHIISLIRESYAVVGENITFKKES